MVLNIEWRCGSEHRNERYAVALNTESKVDNGSECQKKQNMAPNAETKVGNGSEHRYWEALMMALNVETENATRIALNTDTDEWWLWTPKPEKRLWTSN